MTSTKYAKLGEFLRGQQNSYVPMTFAQIEKVLGFPLPPSAYTQRAWWSNNPDNDVMTKVWRKANYKTSQVDMDARKVVFQRQRVLQPQSPAGNSNGEIFRRKLEAIREKKEPDGAPQLDHPRIHPIFGTLKGSVRIVAGTDITAPADPDWAKAKP